MSLAPMRFARSEAAKREAQRPRVAEKKSRWKWGLVGFNQGI